MKSSPLIFQWIVPITQGSPRPRKTFTELLPVMLPTDASAYSSSCAAILEAKVSGKDVPSATKVIAVIESGTPSRQPKSEARSPIQAVTKAIMARELKKQTQPPQKSTGGTKAKISFHGKATK